MTTEQTAVLLDQGRTLIVEFTPNVLMDVGADLKMGFQEIARVLQSDDVHLHVIRAVVHAALKTHQPDIGIKEAGEIMFRAGTALGPVLNAAMAQMVEGLNAPAADPNHPLAKAAEALGVVVKGKGRKGTH